MVETEKVLNHKVASTASDIVQAKGNMEGGVTTSTSSRKLSESGRPGMVTRSTSAYYIFSSLPKVVHSVRPKTGYRNNVSRPRGAHDYFNVMWDPHIYRGTTTTLTSSLKPNAELKEERFRKRRAFGSNQGTNNAYNNITPTTMGSRNKYRMTTKVTSRSRTFPPLEGRHQVHVQTEEYLEDFTRDLTRGEVDAIVQTDPIEDDILDEVGGGGSLKRRYILPEKLGIDASTQVLPGELISFDERVQPVVEALVGKVLEQALLETMEEEEIAALKAQQNRFVEKRQEEERELKRLQEQQERISAEKERLKRHLQVQLEQQAPRAPSENGESEDGHNDDIINPSGGGGGGGGVGSNYLLELLPSVINSLRQEGFLTDQMGDDVLTSFVPMWRTTTEPEGDPDEIRDEDDEGDNSSIENGMMGSQSFPEGYHSRVNSLDELDGNIMAQQDADPDDEQVVEKSGEDLEDNADENDDDVAEAEEEKNCDEQIAEDDGDNGANPEETNDDEEPEVTNEEPPPPANDDEEQPDETGEVEEGEAQEAPVEEKEEQLDEGGEEETEAEEEAPTETDEEDKAKLEGGEEEEEEEEPGLDKKSEEEEETNTDIPDPSIPEEEDNPSPQPQEQLPEAEQSSSSSSQLPNGAIPNVEARQSSEQD